MTDSLTGLANRRAFFATAHGAVEIALRHVRPLAAVMIDIDHFKSINDVHGHAAGDCVLQHVAATLNDLVRGTDTLARYGGEEFAPAGTGNGAGQRVDAGPPHGRCLARSPGVRRGRPDHRDSQLRRHGARWQR